MPLKDGNASLTQVLRDLRKAGHWLLALRMQQMDANLQELEKDFAILSFTDELCDTAQKRQEDDRRVRR